MDKKTKTKLDVIIKENANKIKHRFDAEDYECKRFVREIVNSVLNLLKIN